MDSTHHSYLLDTIAAVFTGKATSDTHVALNAFVETPQCWTATIDLLDYADLQVRYFVANLLYTKVRKNWAQLDDAGMRHILAHMGAYVVTVNSRMHATGNNSDKAFLSRLVLIMCAIYIRCPDGFNSFFRIIADLTKDPTALHNLLLGLELLALFPEEVESSDIARTSKISIESSLLSSSPSVAALMDNLAATIYDKQVWGSVMKVIRAWLPQGMTFTVLFSEHKPSFGLICAGLQSRDSDLLREAICVVHDLFSNSEFPRPANRNEAVLALINCLASNISLIPTYFSGTYATDEVHSVAVEIINTFTCFASREIEQLCGKESIGLNFLRLYIGCISKFPRSLAFLTFDFWIELHQDIDDVDRAAYINEEIIPSLFVILVRHCTYSSEYLKTLSSGELDDDMDDFENFRDTRLGIQELFRLCHCSLKHSFFATLTAVLSMFLNDSKAGWMHLEVVLFVTQSAMESIKSSLNLDNDDDAPLGELQQAAVNFVYTLTKCLLSIPQEYFVTTRVAVIYETIYRYIGSLTFMLTSETLTAYEPVDGSSTAFISMPTKSLFYSAMMSAFAGIYVEDLKASTAAAKAFYQLSIHGSKWLLMHCVDDTDASTHEGLKSFWYWSSRVSEILSNASSKISNSVLLTVIEALTRGIVGMKQRSYLQEQLLVCIGNAITNGLAEVIVHVASVKNVAPFVPRLETLLSCASQVIRFSDSAASSVSRVQHIAHSFIASLWPMLRAISGNTLFTGEKGVASLVFQICGRVFSLTGASAFGELEFICDFVVSVIQSKSPGIADAISCATTIVEVVARARMKSEDEEFRRNLEVYLASIVEKVTRILFDAVRMQYCVLERQRALVAAAATTTVADDVAVYGVIDLSAAFGDDDGCIEMYSNCIHKYLVLCPEILVNSTAFDNVLALWCCCFQNCSEKDPVRSLLQVVQYLFAPIGSRRDAEVDALILQRTACYGGNRIVRLLMVSANDSRLASVLVPNITEALYSIIIAANDHGKSVYTTECKKWFQDVIYDTGCLVQLPTMHYRETLLSLMFTLAHESNRRFRSLMQDVFKICSNELTIDCLLAYSDVE